MLGLPRNTELSRQLPKKAIYAKFQINTATKERIDSDISKISIVNEVSPARVNIAEGKTVKSFYVLSVHLKRREFDERNIITISKIIPQNMVMVLEFGNEARLAVYRTKLLMTKWQSIDTLSIDIKGLDLDKVWENVIAQIGGIELSQGDSIDEQIALDEQRSKLQKEIARTENAARTEKQPKKKFELASEVKRLTKQLEELLQQDSETKIQGGTN